jgi:MarR family transcriptional regulator, organic hydroperoxide resistance regulator
VASVLEEIKQRRPFASRETGAVVGLLRTADVVKRGLTRVVEPHGITLQQYNVLRILRGAGPDGLPTLEIADRMVEQAPGITRLLDRLEAKRLVERQRCPQDRRQVLCRIISAGRRLLALLEQPMEEASRAALRALGRGELAALERALDAIRATHERARRNS